MAAATSPFSNINGGIGITTTEVLKNSRLTGAGAVSSERKLLESTAHARGGPHPPKFNMKEDTAKIILLASERSLKFVEEERDEKEKTLSNLITPISSESMLAAPNVLCIYELLPRNEANPSERCEKHYELKFDRRMNFQMGYTQKAHENWVYFCGGFTLDEDKTTSQEKQISNQVSRYNLMKVNTIDRKKVNKRPLAILSADFATMPNARYGHAIVAHDSKLFITGGVILVPKSLEDDDLSDVNTEEVVSNTMDILDLKTQTWLPGVANMLHEHKDHQLVAKGDHLFLCDAKQHIFEVYNIQTNTWSMGPDLENPAKSLSLDTHANDSEAMDWNSTKHMLTIVEPNHLLFMGLDCPSQTLHLPSLFSSLASSNSNNNADNIITGTNTDGSADVDSDSSTATLTTSNEAAKSDTLHWVCVDVPYPAITPITAGLMNKNQTPALQPAHNIATCLSKSPNTISSNRIIKSALVSTDKHLYFCVCHQLPLNKGQYCHFYLFPAVNPFCDGVATSSLSSPVIWQAPVIFQ